jgi:hypothetical protein
MNDQITALLSQALASALKDALTPIVREAVNEALATMPPKALPESEADSTLLQRVEALEEQMADVQTSLEDKVDTCDIDDKVSEAVSDCLDNGSWDITFRG